MFHYDELVNIHINTLRVGLSTYLESELLIYTVSLLDVQQKVIQDIWEANPHDSVMEKGEKNSQILEKKRKLCRCSGISTTVVVQGSVDNTFSSCFRCSANNQ